MAHDLQGPRLRQTTLDTYTKVVARHLTPALGRVPLQALTPERLQHYLNDKVAHGLDPATVRLHYLVLSNALKQAEKVGRVARNVARLVEAPRANRQQRDTLPMDAVRTRLVGALQGHRLSAAIVTLFLTGVRKGELLGLRWQDIDLDAGVLHVRQTLQRVTVADAGKKTHLAFLPPKTQTSRRTVALPAECVSVLRQHRARQAQEKLRLGQAYQDQGLVFCREDGLPIDPHTLGRTFRQALARAGLPRIRVHDARHTYATWLLQAGVSLKVVSTQLGHAGIAITADVYSHVTAEVARQAADALNAAFTTGR